jgi:hypothetical protein
MTKTREVYDLQKDPQSFWGSLIDAGKLKINVDGRDYRKLKKAAAPQLASEHTKNAARECLHDRFAEDFCETANTLVAAWRRHRGRKPKRGTVCNALMGKNEYPKSRSGMDDLAVKALTPERLARLARINPLDKI